MTLIGNSQGERCDRSSPGDGTSAVVVVLRPGKLASGFRKVAPSVVARAVARLATARPDLSSATLLWPWQRRALGVLAIALLAALVLAPTGLAITITLTLAVPFFSVYLLRLVAVASLYGVPPGRDDCVDEGARADRLADQDCPTYAVLVPLYDEADIVPGLVAALTAIDYPTDRLAVRLVVEEDDTGTQAAIAMLALPGHIKVIVVPRGTPRTKPRALVVALDQTPGELIVVFDAEDMPEAGQLRRAAGVFLHAPPELACLQARLNTFNPDESWLTRQFTIEYSALFDLILPALERYGLPLPLGGTSNHFRRAALDGVLAWDPYNVTEDADLGVRLARFGMRVGVINSTTWEEAPPTFRIWLGQRTRWLKGWMQTYVVHMRAPRRLLRELGWRSFVALQVLMGAMIVSALVHPLFYLLLGYEVATGALLSSADDVGARVMWWLAVTNLILGYMSVVVVGAVAVLRRGRGRLAAHLVLVPVYWLAISLAAYRALAELVRAPFHWEKTRHRAWPLRQGGNVGGTAGPANEEHGAVRNAPASSSRRVL